MDQAIVLKNIRRDIPAMKPLAAKVILLQRQLIQAVQRYQVRRGTCVQEHCFVLIHVNTPWIIAMDSCVNCDDKTSPVSRHL